MADRWTVAGFVLASLAVVATARHLDGNPLKAEDFSPNTKNGAIVSRASTAGLTIALTGDENALYAVSLNAGVWKSTKAGPWQPLPNSPKCAYSIASDPGNPRHLVVGERNGLATSVLLNHCGVSESWDAGKTWSLILDPLAFEHCDSQAVPAVALDKNGTLYAATSVGIAVRSRGAKAFALTPTEGPVTAFSISQTAAWARTRTTLLVSKDYGHSWQSVDIPRQIGPDQVSFTSRGDVFSLGAFDTLAVMPCILSPGAGDNRNALIAYEPRQNRWWTQILTSGNGTGLGGRRYTVSFMTAAGPQLFYGAGQEVHQLTGMDAKGNLVFDKPVMTNWGGPYDTPPHEMHSDMWAIHIPPSFGANGQHRAWIACDGGVYEATKDLRPDGKDASRLFSHKWVTRNDGLHTHHIHTLTALEMPAGKARLAYPTSDNDAFYYDPAQGWMNEWYLGDVNWTDGDVGNSALALMVRRSAGFGMLTAFRRPPPAGASFREDEPITICNDEHYDGPTSFHFIQTLEGEGNPAPLLDAVRLVDLPLKIRDGAGGLVPVPGLLGEPARGGRPALIRNRAFAADPDANRSKFRGWNLEAENLPEGSKEFWVSGGHAHPTYFVLAGHQGVAQLFRLDPGAAGWKPILVSRGIGDSQLVDGGQCGPVFVSPFDPRQVFVLTRDGVLSSQNGGDAFVRDEVLTALITDSGSFPIRAGELTGDNRGVALASRANALATLASMAFDRHHPGVAVAASPFSGVFLLDSAHHWHSAALRQAHLMPASSVALAGDSVYVATEGRGVTKLPSDPRLWPLATRFEVLGTVGKATSIRLLDSLGRPPSTGEIHVRSYDSARRLVQDERVAASGKPTSLSRWSPKADVVDVTYEPTANSGLAPCHTTFRTKTDGPSFPLQR